MAEVTTRKRGKTWEWRFEKASINGKRQWSSKSGYRTKADAVREGTKALNEYNNTGRTFDSNEISVADYLDYWLENAIKKNIGNGYAYDTYLDYESKVRIHLKPEFGAYRLKTFQYAPDIIQKWIDEMKLRGFSKSMVKNTLACLSGAMNYAILPLQFIQSNPCTLVRIGKMPVNQAAKEKTEYICPADEFKRILERFPEDNHFYLSLIVAYNLGTRIGETFGFDLNNDVDFDNHTISIRNQLRKQCGNWFYRPPKYDSYRTIKMGRTVENILRKEIVERKKQMLKYGKYYTRTYLTDDNMIVQMQSDITIPYREIMPLCVKENGELLTPDSFKYCARVIHNELGNPLFHFHCLRHTHGTILAENGANPRAVMEKLGHKDVKTTLQTYTFNTDRMSSETADIFERAVNE